MNQAKNYDARLRSILEYAHASWNLHREPAVDWLRPVASLFAGRCGRLRFLMLLPTSIGNVAIKMQRAFDEAHIEVLGAFEKKHLTDEDKNRISDLINEKLIRQSEDNERRRKIDPKWDEEVLEQHRTSLVPLQALEAGPNARALDALFMAQITGAWTTIETLLGDLWETSLNYRPDPLANLGGQPKRIKAGVGSVSGSPNSKRDSKLVELDLIREHGFDVKNKMGTILKPRFSFSRLEGIREAYSSAFDRNFGQIDRALSDKSLDTLNIVRNLIIHRDGQADAEYVSRAKHLPSAPKIAAGHHISLDGDVVVGLLKPAFAAANSLLIGVDNWIKKNPANAS